MRAPVLGLFGGADPGIPASEIADSTSALKDAGVKRHLVDVPGRSALLLRPHGRRA